MEENSKLKILEGMDCYYPDVDGVVNCMHNYCTTLNEVSDLTVLVPKHRDKKYVQNLPYKVYRSKGIFNAFLKSDLAMPSFDKKLRKTIEGEKYDIVHFHSPFMIGKYMGKVAKKQNVPLVSTYHSNMKRIFKDIVKVGFVANLLCKPLARLYNKCDEIFVCSPLVEKQARDLGCKGKITYLPFGTEIPRCDCVQENCKKANELYNIAEDELVFIFVGRVMKLKRVDMILKALKIAKDNGLKFKFFVVGKGQKLKSLKNLAKKLELSEKEAVFTGFIPRDHFPLLLSRADLLLFPSLYDNFGLVKVESAAFETPGLFIKNSCAGYDIDDGHNGYLSDDSVEAYAQKIMEITKDKEGLKQAGENASKELYINWEDCTKQLHERLEQIVKEHKAKIEEENEDKK